LKDPGNGEPVTHSDAPPAASGPTAGHVAGNATGHRITACAAGKARPRANRRRAEAVGESDGRIRATKVGNGLGTRTQRSKGGQC